MVKIGSTLIYGSQVCRVEDIRNETFGGKTKKYYVLTPIYDERNVIYVPADNPALLGKMREILSTQEIFALIKEMPKKESLWIDDDKERAQQYKEILEKGSREDMVQIIKALYEHKEQLNGKGRKLHSADEIIMQRAEKALYDEFALVLDIKREEVVPFILEQIEVAEKQ